MNQWVEIDNKRYFVMQQRDAKAILGISNRVFSDDAKEGGWRKDKGPAQAVYYYVPEEYYQRRIKYKVEVPEPSTMDQQEASINIIEPQATPFQEVPPSTMKILEKIEEVYRTALDEKEARLKQMEAQMKQLEETKNQVIESKNSEIKGLNHMLENAQSQLVKYREEKKQPDKPWWAFWK